MCSVAYWIPGEDLKGPPHGSRSSRKSRSRCSLMILIHHHRNIFYTYPGSAKPTLKNVSFTVEAGETLAIVGFNGSGTQPKSTGLCHFIKCLSCNKCHVLRQIDTRKYPSSDLRLRSVPFARKALKAFHQRR